MNIIIGTRLADITVIREKIHNAILELSLVHHLTRADKQAINESKAKKPSLQLYRKIKAIMVKILCNLKQFDYKTHLITENILIQTTYYKTLTSRP